MAKWFLHREVRHLKLTTFHARVHTANDGIGPDGEWLDVTRASVQASESVAGPMGDAMSGSNTRFNAKASNTRTLFFMPTSFSR